MKAVFFSLFILTLITPVLVFGQEDRLSYKSMVVLPGGFQTETSDLSQLFTNLYLLSISFAALLAVVKIIIAGLKYSLSDIVTTKSDAIKDIQGALLGLILIISAVLILTIINPTIVAPDQPQQTSALSPLTESIHLVS